MTELHPFRAVVHAADAGNVAPHLSPPYDVLGPRETEELRGRHEHNSVRLAVPAGTEPHARAGRRFREWLERGVLERRPRPALYHYEQTYRAADGTRRTRRAVLGALDLAPLDGGEVLPHEETHPEPKEDRRALMEAAGAQLSPVFLVARDPDGRGRRALASPGAAEPLLHGRTADGQAHRVREVPAGAAARELARVLTRGELLIADGHHRYETARTLAERRPGWPGVRRVLACVVPESDPGLDVQPTHRALTRPPPSGWRAALGECFELRPAPEVDTPAAGERAAAGEARDAAGMVVLPAEGSGGPWRLRPRADALEEAGIDGAGAGIATVVFDRLVLRSAHGVGAEEAAADGLLSYHRDPEATRRAAGEEGAAFYLPPPSLEAVWRATGEGRRLPPKTTYFWPKLPTGLLYRDLRTGD